MSLPKTIVNVISRHQSGNKDRISTGMRWCFRVGQSSVHMAKINSHITNQSLNIVDDAMIWGLNAAISVSKDAGSSINIHDTNINDNTVSLKLRRTNNRYDSKGT